MSLLHADFFRKALIFSELSDFEIQQLVQVVQEIQFNKDAIICEEGSFDDRIFVILKGKVSAWKYYGKADAVLLGEYTVGHLFGEIAVIEKSPRTASVLAEEEVVAATITGTDLRQIMSRSSSLPWAFIRSLSSVVRESNQILTQHLQGQNQELKEAYQQLQHQQNLLLKHERLSNLGKIASLVVHDLRGPLTTLKCINHLMISFPANPDVVRSSYEKIETQISTIEQLVDDILNYVKGTPDLSLSLVSLSQLLEDLCKEQQISGDLQYSLNNAEAPPIFLDYRRIKRALQNLLDNARNAGSAHIILSSWHEDELWYVEITDDGCGMDEKEQNSVFDLFYSNFSGGFGLGMVGVKNIVESHGGTISVRSKKGEGTTIQLRFVRQPHLSSERDSESEKREAIPQRFA